MFVNRYQINLSTLETGATETTINIPINLDFQIVDQAELIQRVFVDVEVEKSINPILDYEKVRFLPLDLSGAHMDRLIYEVDLFGATNYGAIGFTDDDIRYEKNSFKETFLNLSFYDTDNPLNQRLITNITLFSELKPSDLYPINSPIGIPGQPKPAAQIPLIFVVENPILFPKGVSEGYHLYDYKDELGIGDFKYLYMRASFKNAKTGSTTNLMVMNTGTTIDNLVHLLYTRYKLIRNTTGYYYEIDNTYQGLSGITGPNNVSYVLGPVNEAKIKLYKIKAT
jgi:hypothetical protein